MDWGFVAVERPGGERARIACFAMVCHHCGSAHVEFFPNARQENLLIGMLHAFSALGVPATVLTDNMKSVVVRRECRVSREGRVVHIYSDDLSRELVAHAVGTGADSWCEGQWETSPAQPEELPTQPVGTVVEQIAPPRAKPGFERFDFGRAE